MRYIITFVSAIIIIACASNKNTIQAELNTNNSFGVSDSTVIAKLKTTGCFGKCPTYELKVFANGYCTYDAKKWTDLDPGFYHGKIDTSIVNELHNIGERIGFKNYKNIYTNPYIVDKPSVFLSLFIPEHDSIKTVERIIDYPQEIWDLENKLKAIFDNTEWKSTADKNN